MFCIYIASGRIGERERTAAALSFFNCGRIGAMGGTAAFLLFLFCGRINEQQGRFLLFIFGEAELLTLNSEL